MAIQFILGNSGSGKTEYMYGAIVREAAKHPKKNYLVIVPEQFTMQTQKKLVELSANHAIMNIDVLSFKRLAYRVFDDLGIQNLSVLEETGKNLVLRKLSMQLTESLTVLRPNIERMGYIEELKSLISELAQYNVTPERLREYADDKNIAPAFAAKMKDVANIYEAFLSYMKGKYVTAEEILNILIEVAPESELLKDSVIVFDEFTGFTPIQNRLIYTILPMIDRMYVILTVDAKEDFYHITGEHELFYLSKKTIATFLKMAQDSKQEVLDPVVLGDSKMKRFAGSDNLAFMEQNLFRKWYKKSDAAVDDIQIHCARNGMEEMVFVSRQIRQLVQKDGYRYRDIAVVTGAVEEYQPYIKECFAKYDIPYFMDQTTEVTFHPFIECVRAALEIVESNFSYEAVMRFLRCGFTDIVEEDIDALENYLLAVAIKGRSAWEKKWLRKTKDERALDLKKLEELRIQLIELMMPLYDAFHGKDKTARGEIIALYQMLEKMQIQQKLWQKEAEYLELGLQDKSKEYGQIFQIVMQLLEKYEQLLGEEALNINEFIEILDAGLSAANVAVIPPGYDSVTVGDIERTRLSNVKILLFIGVNDGIIPKAGGKGGIISEYERQMMKEANIELAPGAREQSFIQRFYLYRNLTKPTDKLFISYAKVNAQGKAIRPSYLIEVMLRLFMNLQIQNIEQLYETMNLSTRLAARDYLIYGEHNKEWYSLAKLLLQEEHAKEIEALIEAPYYAYANNPISKAVAQAIYGKKLKGSVTRLEQYAVCAYKHFLEYGLKLKERELASFENMDMGNLYHDAIKRYSNLLEQSKWDWFHISDENRISLCNQAMEEAILSFPSMSIYATAENKHLADRMKGIFEQTIWALTKQVRAGSFVPKEYEVSFMELEQLESLQLSFSADESMQLLGRIDRVDLAQSDNKLYVKIIDYKSGNTKFDLVRIYQGLSLQLIVYMAAAMEHVRNSYAKTTVEPGAVLYYHIDDPIIEVAGNEQLSEADYENQLLSALKPDGLVNAEEEIYRLLDKDFEKKSDVIPVLVNKNGELSANAKVASTDEFLVIEEYVRNYMKYQGKQIYQGVVDVNPIDEGTRTSCSFCPYGGVCGIDVKIPGYSYRKLKTQKKDEVLQKMQTENELWQSTGQMNKDK